MELSDLSADERVVLAALVQAAALANGVTTPEEGDDIHSIAEALGEEAYAEANREAERLVRDQDSLRALLGNVQRQEARETIYAALIELASVDSVDPGEGELLGMLENAWNVSVEFEPTDELSDDDD